MALQAEGPTLAKAMVQEAICLGCQSGLETAGVLQGGEGSDYEALLRGTESALYPIGSEV